MGLPRLPFFSKRSSSAAGPSTFTAIFDAHFDEVARMARRFGAPARESEDIAQLVFIALHRAIQEKRYTFDAPPGPWLRTATLRTTRNYAQTLRSQGEPTALQDGGFEPMEPRPDPERSAQATELHELALELLDNIPYDLRVVFVLHEMEGLTLSEIAEDLDIQVSTARWHLALAREKFEAALRRRRAEDRRKYGPRALILPLGMEAILRQVRSLPPASSPDAKARVWARLQREIAVSPPARPRLRRPREGMVRPTRGSFVLVGLAFAAGIMVGAMGLELKHHLASPPSPPHEDAPVVAVAPPVNDVDDDDLLSSRPEPAPDDTSAATPVAPHAALDPGADAAAERRCLQKAKSMLSAGNPHGAIAELSRCEERFSVTHFPGVRDQIRRDADAALSRTP